MPIWIIFWYFLRDLEKNNKNNFSLNIFKKSRIWKYEYYLFWVTPSVVSVLIFLIIYFTFKDYEFSDFESSYFTLQIWYLFLSIVTVFLSISTIKRFKDCCNLNILYSLIPCSIFVLNLVFLFEFIDQYWEKNYFSIVTLTLSSIIMLIAFSTINSKPFNYEEGEENQKFKRY